jgi:hypothetical protein
MLLQSYFSLHCYVLYSNYVGVPIKRHACTKVSVLIAIELNETCYVYSCVGDSMPRNLVLVLCSACYTATIELFNFSCVVKKELAGIC